MLRLALLLVAVSLSAQTIDVSPTGPIKTLLAARDAARGSRRPGSSVPIKIILHNGTYYLPETLVLDEQDSNTAWQAAPGEHPIISGGRIITNWTKGPGPVWQAHASAPYFRQLFIDDRRATRARTPNYGFFRADGPSSQHEPFELHFRGSDIQPRWAGRDVEVITLLAWSDLRMPIFKVDEATHTATLAADPQPSNKEPDARYFIENTPDALDAPGEWCLDQASGLVSYIPLPGENVMQAQVIAPALSPLSFSSAAHPKQVTSSGILSSAVSLLSTPLGLWMPPATLIRRPLPRPLPPSRPAVLSIARSKNARSLT